MFHSSLIGQSGMFVQHFQFLKILSPFLVFLKMPLNHSSSKCEELNLVTISFPAGHWLCYVLPLTVTVLVGLVLVGFLPVECVILSVMSVFHFEVSHAGFVPGLAPSSRVALCPPDSLKMVEMIFTVGTVFTVSCSYLPLPCPQDSTF